jgi:hypothetical protein
MGSFIGLSIDEQRELYATLSPDEQAEMDARGLKQMWRSRRATEAHRCRQQNAAAEFKAAVANGDPVPRRLNPAMREALQRASARNGVAANPESLPPSLRAFGDELRRLEAEPDADGKKA